MTDETTNNPPSAPKGQAGEGLVEPEDYDKLSDEELDKLAKAPPKEPPAATEKEGDTPAKPAKDETAEPPPEEEFDDLKSKKPEEYKKGYINLRKKLDEQGKELGVLRKESKEIKELDSQMKQYQIDNASRKIVETEIKGMSDEEKQKFYDDFSTDPVQALMPYIQKALKPLATMTMRQANEVEIKRLIDTTKDDRVPYKRKAVDKIIASYTKADGRNDLFERYSTGAFQEAYRIYRNQNIDKAIEKEQQAFREKAQTEAEELANKKLHTYVEPQGVTSPSQAGATNFETMPMKDLEKKVKATEKRR